MTFEPQAVLTLTNVSGIQIMIHPSGVGLYYRFVSDDSVDEVKEAEIKYNTDEEYGEIGEAYFETDTYIADEQRFVRFDLGEFMTIRQTHISRQGIPRDSEIRKRGTR